MACGVGHGQRGPVLEREQVVPHLADRGRPLHGAGTVEREDLTGAASGDQQLVAVGVDRGECALDGPAEGRLPGDAESEEHTSELQSRFDLVCRLLLEKKKKYYLSLRRYTL